jgi:hypothetical protein
MGSVAVVHLVRYCNGIGPFQRFLRSYRAHPTGLKHDLVLIFKGFPRQELPTAFVHLLEGLAHKFFFLPDRGFDLRPYFAAVRRCSYRYFCFLNSFSQIAAPDWLEALHSHVVQPGVGLVGATGSYESFANIPVERRAAVRTLGAAVRLRSQMVHVMRDPEPQMIVQRTAAWVLGALRLWDPARHFPAFPNHHIRTNAFMASRETLLRVRVRPLLFKLAAFQLESGRDGITRQITDMGLRALVIDRHGRAFDKDSWHASNTFRQSQQEDVLVEDNQTQAYSRADHEQRARLSRAAWGAQARPG